MFLYLKSLRFLNVLSRYFLCWSAYPPMPGRENQSDNFLKCFYKPNHLFSPKWALEVSGYNTQILKAVCWSIEAWLRRPETMQNILLKMYQCIEKAFLPGTLTVGLTLWAGANNLSNFYVSCVWKNLTRKGQLQKSREGIVLEEALCCENEFFTLTATLVPHNPAVAVCKWTHLRHHVWYETNPLRSLSTQALE